jgi:hypothetical protein
VPADHLEKLVILETDTADVRVLSADGLLDNTTYIPLRDKIIKAALDEPRAVVIDVSQLVVPSPSALAVFTSARWHVGMWPDVPIVLVCSHLEGRRALEHNGIARYVPVFPSTNDALAAVSACDQQAPRRRAKACLPPTFASVSHARTLAAEWLSAWSRPELISVAKLIVTVFVENVLIHTGSAPALRVECRGDLVTIAVEDTSTTPATRSEHPDGHGDEVSGLAIVASLARAWGSSPTSSGKTVWAVIGPKNEL